VRGTREGHPHSCGTAPDFRGGPAGTGFPLIGLRIRAEGHPCPGVFSWCEEYRAAACSASSDSDSPCSAALRSCLPSPTLGARGAPAGTVRWWRPHLDGTLAHEAPRYRSMRMPTRFDRLSAWARVRSVVSQSGGDCFPSGCCAIVGLRQGPSRAEPRGSALLAIAASCAPLRTPRGGRSSSSLSSKTWRCLHASAVHLRMPIIPRRAPSQMPSPNGLWDADPDSSPLQDAMRDPRQAVRPAGRSLQGASPDGGHGVSDSRLPPSYRVGD